MYTLYGMTGSCSMAVHIILGELSQPVKVIDVRVPEGQSRPAEFLAINPRGNVPVLIEDGHAMREGGAILSYLLDKHNSPMLPKSGPERMKALEWLMFANATMHPAYSRVFFLMAAMKDAPEAVRDAVLGKALKAIDKLWAEVDAELAKTPYICGSEVSAADILLSVIANWGHSNHGGFATKLTLGQNVKRMLKAVTARPAYQSVLADEGITYRAAA